MSHKCESELGTHVPEEFKLDWAKKASRAGCSASELLRDLICFNLHGVTFTEYVTQCRREALGLPALNQGQFSPSSEADEPRSRSHGV